MGKKDVMILIAFIILLVIVVVGVQLAIHFLPRAQETASQETSRPTGVVQQSGSFANIRQRSNQQPGQASSPNTEAGGQIKTAQVAIVADGFSPATIAVFAGTSVSWVNQDIISHQIGADPYPSHSSLPDLVSPVLAPADVFSYFFAKKGTFSYHDEKNPYSVKGIVIVR